MFNTTQYVMAIPPLIRSNIDYVIALKEPVKANRRKLYEYFYGVFPSFEEFESTFAACTDNYGCMVLDRTKGDTSLRSMIRFYRASAKLPPFTIGGGGVVEKSEKEEDAQQPTRTSRTRRVLLSSVLPKRQKSRPPPAQKHILMLVEVLSLTRCS